MSTGKAQTPGTQASAAATQAVEKLAAEAIAFAREAQARGETPLIFASAPPEAVRTAQQALGPDLAGMLVERTLAAVASGLLDSGTRRFVVAGGETSGAVVQALDAKALRIGPQIDPGVPWTETLGEKPIAIALKSGNFGAPDFFEKALGLLDSGVRTRA